MWRTIILIFAIFFLIFTACAGEPEVVEVTRVTMMAFEEDGVAAVEEPAIAATRVVNDTTADLNSVAFRTDNVGNVGQAETAVQPQQPPTQDRLIIRNANLSLTVPDTEQAIADIGSMAENNGGWVVDSNVFSAGERKRGSITVRVPATGFNSALETMKELASEVNNESITGQDVTDEFVDLTLRLENLEATADRVRAFLDDATEVEDALNVNRELSRLEEEIELIKGRQQYLSQSAAFSTITVELRPDALAQPPEFGRWSPQGIAKDAVEALVDTLQGVGGFLIWFGIYLLPVGLLVGVPLYFVARGVRRWWRGRRGVENTAVEEVATS